VLPTGTKLGPYEVVEPLGADGMGEAYIGSLEGGDPKVITAESRALRV